MSKRAISKKTSYDTIVELRPVTPKDTWCKFRSRLTQQQQNSSAPYGYILTVPKYRHNMVLDVNGTIIRNRVFLGQLYLQVIPKKKADYITVIKKQPGIKWKNKKRQKSKKVISKYMNIINCNKYH